MSGDEVLEEDNSDEERKRKQDNKDREEEKKRRRKITKQNMKEKKARAEKEEKARRKEKAVIDSTVKAKAPGKKNRKIASADILTKNILTGAGKVQTRSTRKGQNGTGRQQQADSRHEATDSRKGYSQVGPSTESKQGGTDTQRESRLKELWTRLRPEEEGIEGGEGTGGDDGPGGEGDEGDREWLAGKAKGGDNDEDWTEPGDPGGNRRGKGRGRRDRGGGKLDNSTPSMLDYVARSPVLGVRRDREPGTTPEDRSKKARGRPPFDPGYKLDMDKFPPGVSSLVFHPNPERGGAPYGPEAARSENEAWDSLEDHSMSEGHLEQQYTDYGSLGEGGDDY